MLEMGTSGLMSGDEKRGGGAASVPAPILDSTHWQVAWRLAGGTDSPAQAASLPHKPDWVFMEFHGAQTHDWQNSWFGPLAYARGSVRACHRTATVRETSELFRQEKSLRELLKPGDGLPLGPGGVPEECR